MATETKSNHTCEITSYIKLLTTFMVPDKMHQDSILKNNFLLKLINKSSFCQRFTVFFELLDAEDNEDDAEVFRCDPFDTLEMELAEDAALGFPFPAGCCCWPFLVLLVSIFSSGW